MPIVVKNNQSLLTRKSLSSGYPQNKVLLPFLLRNTLNDTRYVLSYK